MEAGLRQAVEHGDFVLHYQPQIDLESGDLVGAEALLRWKRNGNLILPEQFMPLAEDTGLMVPIGEWVIREACRQQGAWVAAGMPQLPVAVNVSASELRRDFAERLRALISNCPHWLGKLEIELSEAVLMKEGESWLPVLQELKKLGLAVVLDDFGVGYSKLGHLHRLPLDGIKVDRSLVRDLGRGPAQRAMTEAIINLAHGLGIRVVAEGVEDEEEVRLLRAQHCEEVQGRYLAPPLPPSDFLAWWQVLVARRGATMASEKPQGNGPL
jgi:EAL domain-containing protein (putative c-di-GMP-specific phosphodiesterase class I)